MRGCCFEIDSVRLDERLLGIALVFLGLVRPEYLRVSVTVGDERGEEGGDNDANFLAVLQEVVDLVRTLGIEEVEEEFVAASKSGVDGAARVQTDVTPDGVLLQIAIM